MYPKMQILVFKRGLLAESQRKHLVSVNEVYVCVLRCLLKEKEL